LSLIQIPPFWRIVPPTESPAADGKTIVLAPGVGFGSGEHETTKLCLQAVAVMAPKDADSWRMLDFGSGSGILAVGAAKLGATVDAVEIDEAAIAEGIENVALNGVSDRVRFTRTLEGLDAPYEMVVANILRSILLDFAEDLVSRIAPGGTLVLSGLVGTDVPEITARYGVLLGGRRPDVYQRGDWRALAWRNLG
jgi:ribosomal protein L11 methyltransferase